LSAQQEPLHTDAAPQMEINRHLTLVTASVRELPLTKGYVAIVDAIDFDRVNTHRWAALVQAGGRRVYAHRGAHINGRRIEMRLHRFIMNAPPQLHVDHIDGNTLNNTRANLRLASNAQNLANQTKGQGVGWGHGSRFKGVSPHRTKWQVRVGKITVGIFADEVEAARAYDAVARTVFGPFARLNFPGHGEQSAARSPSAPVLFSAKADTE